MDPRFQSWGGITLGYIIRGLEKLMPPNLPTLPYDHEIKLSEFYPIITWGFCFSVSVTLLGFAWTGGRSAEEIRKARMKAEEEQKEAAKSQQQQQLLQHLQGGGDPSSFSPSNVNSAEINAINEVQKNLSIILQAANTQFSKGQYDKALMLYQKAFEIIPPSIPQYDTFALEIIPKLVTCFMQTNRGAEANDFLNSMKPLLSSKPETILSFDEIRAQVLEFLSLDVELEALLLQNISSAQLLYGENSVKFINQLFAHGTFLVKKKKFREAIEKFQTCLRFHSITGMAPSQEEFAIYRQIQRCHLLLDEKEEALGLLERIKLLTEDPITIAWQMHHTATLLLETNFNDDAEDLFKDILSDYPVSPSGEFDNPRIKSLVSNTVSEYALYVYNVGRRDEAQYYLDLIKQHRWGVLSSSIYLMAKAANIYFAPKGDSGFLAKINCEFALSKRFKKGMIIDFETEIEGKDSATVEIEEGMVQTKFTGKEVTQIENKIYTVTAKIYSDKSRSQLLFTHFQYVPSTIDTRNMKTWKELEEGFRAAKKI